MPDFITALAIIGTVATIVSVYIGYLVLRRTPKLPKPPIMPTCTTILGASIDNHISDLPTFSSGMRRMGFEPGSRRYS